MNKRRLLIQYIGITMLFLLIVIIVLLFVNIFFIVIDIPISSGEMISESIAYIVGFCVVKKLLKNIKIIDHISFSKLDIKIIIAIITLFSSLSIAYNNFSTWLLYKWNLTSNFFIDNSESSANEYSSLLGLILGLLSVAIIAPIIEELYFRVLSIDFLRKDFSITISVIISSFIFSIAHVSQVQDTIELFISSIIMAAIYIKTKNVFYSIVAHMTHNIQYAIFMYCINNNIKIFNQNVMVDFCNVQVFSNRLYIFSIILMIISSSYLITLMYKEKCKKI